MKKIYKIFGIILMLSMILSIVSVNVSAFEKEVQYDEILGDQDDSPPYYSCASIYGEDYILLNCGNILALNCGSTDFENFYNLDVLNDFLYQYSIGVVESPYGSYLYSSLSGTTIEYLEFFILGTSRSGSIPKLESLGSPYRVGDGSAVYYDSTLIVDEIEACREYRYKFTYNYWDSLYFSEDRVEYLVVAIYMNGYSPFDEVNDLNHRLEETEDNYKDIVADKDSIIDDLNHRIQSIDDNYKDALAAKDTEINVLTQRWNDEISDRLKLEYDFNTLNTSYESLKSDYYNLIDEYNDLNLIYNDLRFDKETADMIDELFTGVSKSVVTIISGISSLGYSPKPGVNVTVGGLITVALLGAFLLFILRLVFGGSRN